MELTETQFKTLINIFDSLVTEEYQLDLGDLSDLRTEVYDSEDGIIVLPSEVTKSGTNECIILKDIPNE